MGDGDDAGNAHQEDEKDNVARGSQGPECVGLLLPHHEAPVLVPKPSRGIEKLLTVRVFVEKGPRSFMSLKIGRDIRVLIHQTPSRPTFALKKSLGIDQIGLACFPNPDLLHHFVEEMGVYRGSQDPFHRILFSCNGNNKMRNPSVSEKHITDIRSLFENLLQPRLFSVVPTHQLEGPVIRDMGSLLIEDTQVYKCG